MNAPLVNTNSIYFGAFANEVEKVDMDNNTANMQSNDPDSYSNNSTIKESNFKTDLKLNETETEYMERLGYVKVYDSGLTTLHEN